jgi:copper(I)-binding protein
MPLLLLLPGMVVAGPAATVPVPSAPAMKIAPATVAGGPRVSEAWIAEAPPAARHNAAYLVLRNGSRADTLVAVETPVAEVAEIHEMRQEKGLTRMRREATMELAPDAELRLQPGGRHIMLINMKRALKPGERVPLTLRFRKAGLIVIDAEVRPLAVDVEAADPHAHHHGH